MQMRSKQHLLIFCVVMILATAALAATKLIGFKSRTFTPASGTKRMAERLATIARSVRPENGFNNQEAIDQLRSTLTEPLSERQQPMLRQALGYQLLIVRQVAITWPVTGRTDFYEHLPMDHFVTIKEGRSTPIVLKTKSFSLSPTRGREPPPTTCCEPKKP